MKSSTAVGIGNATGFEAHRIRSTDTALQMHLGGDSHLVVLDVDVHGLPDATPDEPHVQSCQDVLGASLWERLTAVNTRTVRTGSGGLHFYFAVSQGVRYKKSHFPSVKALIRDYLATKRRKTVTLGHFGLHA